MTQNVGNWKVFCNLTIHGVVKGYALNPSFINSNHLCLTFPLKNKCFELYIPVFLFACLFERTPYIKERMSIPMSTDYGRQWSFFDWNPKHWQTNWADKFWSIWDIFSQFISTHFGTVSPLSMFFINQPLFLQTSKPLIPNPKYLFGIGIGIWIWIWAAKN